MSMYGMCAASMACARDRDSTHGHAAWMVRDPGSYAVPMRAAAARIDRAEPGSLLPTTLST